jgi:corrinoid protein of di/trimethylamine methyltransferase
MAKETLLDTLKQAVRDGEDGDAAQAAQALLDMKVAPLEIIKSCITPALDEIGIAFENGEAYLPELMLAGDAARAALDLIVPQISSEDAQQAVRGTVVIGTIFGDAHDIGKNIVIALLAAYGCKIIDLGINVPVRDYIETAQKENADIIAISSLITTSLPYQREIINQLRDRSMRDKFFVIVGGGPVTPEWTEQIGADGYGRDAKDAASLVMNLLESKNAGKGAPLDKPIIIGALKHG